MALSDLVNTFGQDLLKRYGTRVHKLAIHAGFTCPNRDGSKGVGGCSFCNNVSFSPNAAESSGVLDQVRRGQEKIDKRTRATRFLAYFQAYTNTYDKIERLESIYREALSDSKIVGLSIGTRPDCVPEPVLDLLATLQDEGNEIWLELGLQSASDETLNRVNRGHSFAEYQSAVALAHERKLNLCTHLIIGLPGEEAADWHRSMDAVLKLGTQGLKIHPLHVVKGTQLAIEWHQGEYQPLTMEAYIETVADLIEITPPDVTFHRLTGTASKEILLTPQWCSKKWAVLNGIEHALLGRGSYQGFGLNSPNRAVL